MFNYISLTKLVYLEIFTKPHPVKAAMFLDGCAQNIKLNLSKIFLSIWQRGGSGCFFIYLHSLDLHGLIYFWNFNITQNKVDKTAQEIWLFLTGGWSPVLMEIWQIQHSNTASCFGFLNFNHFITQRLMFQFQFCCWLAINTTLSSFSHM